MKKLYIDCTKVSYFFQAMNKEEGIFCETKDGVACEIKEIHCTPGIDTQVTVRIDYAVDGVTRGIGELPSHFRIYSRVFENGDYVRQQCGDILICAGVKNGRYLFHAALDKQGELQFPDCDYYTYGAVMHDDRLCTKEEQEKLDKALLAQRKHFNPALGEVKTGVCKAEIDWSSQSADRIHSFTLGLSEVPKFGLLFITISKENGNIEVPAYITSEQLDHVIVRCTDILRARAERKDAATN